MKPQPLNYEYDDTDYIDRMFARIEDAEEETADDIFEADREDEFLNDEK